jgi:hypothetical protein
MSEYESAAMWDLYSTQACIAIWSRISRLQEAIPKEFDPGSWGLYGNVVNYVDFQMHSRPWTSATTDKPVVRAADLHRDSEFSREFIARRNA